jgi:hypothetical protein
VFRGERAIRVCGGEICLQIVTFQTARVFAHTATTYALRVEGLPQVIELLAVSEPVEKSVQRNKNAFN